MRDELRWRQEAGGSNAEERELQLLEEITELSKSLARYGTYMKDAEDANCSECVELWRGMRERHEQDLDSLMRHMKKHIDSGMLEFGSQQTRRAA